MAKSPKAFAAPPQPSASLPATPSRCPSPNKWTPSSTTTRAPKRPSASSCPAPAGKNNHVRESPVFTYTKYFPSSSTPSRLQSKLVCMHEHNHERDHEHEHIPPPDLPKHKTVMGF